MTEALPALISTQLLGLAMVLPRIALAFIILPLLGKDMVPPLVRNSLLVAFAAVLLPMSQYHAPTFFSQRPDWLFLLLKEAFVGLSIGFVFSGIFWALNTAGGIIDTQTGSNMANVVDPVMGHQSAPVSQFMVQFGAVLFMVTGAFLIFMDVLFQSFLVWPVDQLLPLPVDQGMDFFAQQFGFIMTRAVLLSAPFIAVLFLVDLALGLINRFAQHMNLMAIATPVKAMLAILVLMLGLGIIAESIVHQIGLHRSLIALLKQSIG